MANLISIGQVFDKTVEHYKEHFAELIGISAWMVVAAVPAAVAKFIAPFTEDNTLNGLDWTVIILNNVGGLLLTVVSILTLIMIVLAAQDHVNGTKIPIAKRVAVARKLFFPYVWTSFLFVLLAALALAIPFLGWLLIILSPATNIGFILSAIGAILLAAGGIIAVVLIIKFTIQYSFAPYSLILTEEPKMKTVKESSVGAAIKQMFSAGIRSMKNSSALVKGRWWATFFRFVIPQFIYALALSLISFLALSGLMILIALTLGPNPLGEGVGNGVWLLLSMAVTALFTPLIALTDFYIFDSLRKTR
jgi:hypothetical protein